MVIRALQHFYLMVEGYFCDSLHYDLWFDTIFVINQQYQQTNSTVLTVVHQHKSLLQTDSIIAGTKYGLQYCCLM
jgi:hypothetical protein